jgi:muconate cycloisomerase
MARVRRKGGIPVMADESMTDHASLIAIIKADAADLVKVSLKQCGGFHRTANIIATAEAAGIRCAVGHGFGTNVSTVAETALASISHNVIDGLECVGPLKMKDHITTTPVDLASGSLVLSADPGLGLLLDDDKIRTYQWVHTTVGK